MGFFNTFRGRLLLILAFLLVATLSIQFYLNLRTQNENNERRDLQLRTLVSGVSLGVSGITSKDEFLDDLILQAQQSFLDDRSRENIVDVILINQNWQIIDSLNSELVPRFAPDGSPEYLVLNEITGLPPLMEETRLGEDAAIFPNRKTDENKKQNDEAHAIPIETSEGRYYVMVILKNDRSAAAWRAAEPLVYTLGIVLVSTAITFFLVWRFTSPITDLSNAARRIADGDLGFRIPTDRTDEIGRLTQRFNEMTSELEKSKALEEQLQQAEKSAVVGRLGSAIAHEIRNPLNYINLTLDHLRSKFAPDGSKDADKYHKLISQIKDEVKRINQQISDFLNYSRPANVDLRPLNAREVVEDSLRIVEAQAEESNIKIAVIEHEDVPNIMGDPEFLRSVFNNLFINAVQAMGNEGGQLNVKLSADDDPEFVRIEISDTGSGIPEENLSKIFEPYFSTKETGTGLGLAIVQKIIDVHNGSIVVESSESEGTKFMILLPTIHQLKESTCK